MRIVRDLRIPSHKGTINSQKSHANFKKRAKIERMVNMNNNRIIGNEGKTKLIVVRSNENKGKTTTIWMVLYELLSRGASVRFHDYSGRNTPPATMPPVGSLPDFEADVNWDGKHIIIFSYGDGPRIVQKLMDDALPKHPDYILCASRSQNRTNSVWELFDTRYTNLRFERVCFWSEHTPNVADALLVKQSTVEAIIKYMA